MDFLWNLSTLWILLNCFLFLFLKKNRLDFQTILIFTNPCSIQKYIKKLQQQFLLSKMKNCSCIVKAFQITFEVNDFNLFLFANGKFENIEKPTVIVYLKRQFWWFEALTTICMCLSDCLIEHIGLVLSSVALLLSLSLNCIFCFRKRASLFRGMVIKLFPLASCFAGHHYTSLGIWKLIIFSTCRCRQLLQPTYVWNRKVCFLFLNEA